jgi:DNA-binding protein YbaB
MAKQVSISDQMVDITQPEHEVEIMYSGGVLWINIDGMCRLRCTQIKPELLTWDIDREKPKE